MDNVDICANAGTIMNQKEKQQQKRQNLAKGNASSVAERFVERGIWGVLVASSFDSATAHPSGWQV